MQGAAQMTIESDIAILRTNLADAAVVAAMKDGRVTSDLVKLDFRGPKSAHDGFKPMIREGAYDAGEMAIVTYFQAKAYGKPLVLLPVPVLGRTQHHCIGFNRELGHLEPKDIEGRKVGVRTYAQTTGLWVRGILQHEYGVDLDKVLWQTIDEAHLSEYSDPSTCTRLPPNSNLPQLMFNGEVAAAILGNEMPKDPRVQTLVPDPFNSAEAWCKREGVFPINHMFVVTEQLSRERPDIVREIYRMLVESRALAPESVRSSLPPIGLEANRKTLEMALQWSWEQHILPRRVSIDELFDETTAAL
jgi:4,5-dihydroxyphthalate decarboxylase